MTASLGSVLKTVRREMNQSLLRRTSLNSSRRDAEACALDGLADGGHVGPGGQTHLAALEIDGNGRCARTRGGTCYGLYAAVAIHAGDLEDEFLSHVI